jgi:hypothetical protein
MALISTTDEFMSEMSGLEPHKSFAKAKGTAYSAGVIEDVASKYFSEMLNDESQSLRFAFYGAIHSLEPNDFRIADLVELISGRDEDGLISFMLRMVGNPNSIEEEYNSKVWEISRTHDRVISSLDELSGRGESGWTYEKSPQEIADWVIADQIVAADFIILCELYIMDTREYLIASKHKAGHSYPLALYLAIANPRIKFECELPEASAKTYSGDWGRGYGYGGGLPNELFDIFESACRVQAFYGYLKLLAERSENMTIFEWDPYQALLFTRPDLSKDDCTEYILKTLNEIPEWFEFVKCVDHGIWNFEDEYDEGEEAWSFDLEIACLYTTSADTHQKVFDLGSMILNLALLLNPAISQDLRSQINSSGIKIEFSVEPDLVEILVVRAQEFEDLGLVAILRSALENP